MNYCVMSWAPIGVLISLGTGPLPVIILLHKTKDIAGVGKDASLEGCYYNSAQLVRKEADKNADNLPFPKKEICQKSIK